jgi:hypothetical protein
VCYANASGFVELAERLAALSMVGELEVDVGRWALADAVPVFTGATALRVGFGTPLGLPFALPVEDLTPDIASQPRVSQ